jgi:hypothetical protein
VDSDEIIHDEVILLGGGLALEAFPSVACERRVGLEFEEPDVKMKNELDLGIRL